jgi:protein-disulfide isomerase
MENGEQNVDRWVEERMTRLEPAGEWRPNVDGARVRVAAKDRVVRVQRRRWGVTLAAGIAVASSLFVIPGCQAATCKIKSENLAERLWKSVFEGAAQPRPGTVEPPRVQKMEPQAAAPVPGASNLAASAERRPRPSPAPATTPKNFKEAGSSTAPIACEVYTDYECPACAQLYAELMPQLMKEYVATGKVKLLHRDYPLTYHTHSRLAARFANAAGQLGHYEEAVYQIFRTQSAWGLTGDIDGQLMQVLAPGVMQKVRDLVRNDAHLDDTVSADITMGREDQIGSTPSIVIVARGQRRVVTHVDFAMLKSMLDELLR